MRIIVWSGGADSTLILTNELLKQPRGTVSAITLEHTQLGYEMQRKMQHKAREKYKRWVKKKHGIVFEHRVVTVALAKNTESSQFVGQYGLFLNHIFPYAVPQPSPHGIHQWQSQHQGGAPESNALLFGYIKKDEFWHYKAEFKAAFISLVALTGLDQSRLTLEFPLEWMTKENVIVELDSLSVPNEAWWTCESSMETPCGTCPKCKDLQQCPSYTATFPIRSYELVPSGGKFSTGSYKAPIEEGHKPWSSGMKMKFLTKEAKPEGRIKSTKRPASKVKAKSAKLGELKTMA